MDWCGAFQSRWLIFTIIENNLYSMHHKFHDFYGVHVYLRSNRISLMVWPFKYCSCIQMPLKLFPILRSDNFSPFKYLTSRALGSSLFLQPGFSEILGLLDLICGRHFFSMLDPIGALLSYLTSIIFTVQTFNAIHTSRGRVDFFWICGFWQ